MTELLQDWERDGYDVDINGLIINALHIDNVSDSNTGLYTITMIDSWNGDKEYCIHNDDFKRIDLIELWLEAIDHWYGYIDEIEEEDEDDDDAYNTIFKFLKG